MQVKYLEKDLEAKLDSTIFRYRGRVYFFRVRGTKLHGYDLSGMDSAKVEVDAYDPDVDISSIELGYLNDGCNKMAMYVRRNPVRKFKQGVCLQSLTINHVFYNSFQARPLNSANVLILQSSVQKCLNGSYPDLRYAVNGMTNWGSIALSNQVAITYNPEAMKYHVLILGEHIGDYNKETNVLVVKPGIFGHMYSVILSSFPWRVE